MSNQKRFFSGVLWLAFSNILIKAAGLLFKIPLTHILDETGMAYFNTAYNIYAWFYMLTTAGLSVAVSMIVSENRAKANFGQIKIILRTVLLLFFFVGLAGTLIMVFGADKFAELIKVPEASICIMAIAPSLFFSCMSSALRGYFQGFQIMFPTAVSQLLEALGKLFIGISIASYTRNTLGMEVDRVAAFSLLGIAIGVGAGFLFLCGAKLFFNEKKYENEYTALEGSANEIAGVKKVAAQIIKIAVPITISSSVMSLTNIIDTMLMTDRLMASGVSNLVAKEIYGNYTSLAVPMFNLPPVLIYSITYSVVPLISAALARREKENAKRYIHSSMKLTSLISLPCAIGLSVLSYQILSLFFKADHVEKGAGMLSVLAPSVFFVCMLAITTSVLQAAGKEKLPIISMLAGSAVKLAGSFFLIPVLGKYGTPASTFLCYLTTVVINMYFVVKHTGVRPRVLEVYVKPLISCVLCGVSAAAVSYYTRNTLGLKLSTVLAILAAVIVYFGGILIFKSLEKEDFMLIPKGEKIYNLLNKLHMVK